MSNTSSLRRSCLDSRQFLPLQASVVCLYPSNSLILRVREHVDVHAPVSAAVPQRFGDFLGGIRMTLSRLCHQQVVLYIPGHVFQRSCTSTGTSQAMKHFCRSMTVLPSRFSVTSRGAAALYHAHIQLCIGFHASVFFWKCFRSASPRGGCFAAWHGGMISLGECWRTEHQLRSFP